MQRLGTPEVTQSVLIGSYSVSTVPYGPLSRTVISCVFFFARAGKYEMNKSECHIINYLLASLARAVLGIIIISLASSVNNMKRILWSDWLPEWVRWAHHPHKTQLFLFIFETAK